MTILGSYRPVNKVLVFIAYAQMSPINAHADVSSEAISLNFGMSLRLHPYFVYGSSEYFCVCTWEQTHLSLRCLPMQLVPKSCALAHIRF